MEDIQVTQCENLRILREITSAYVRSDLCEIRFCLKSNGSFCFSITAFLTDFGKHNFEKRARICQNQTS